MITFEPDTPEKHAERVRIEALVRAGLSSGNVDTDMDDEEAIWTLTKDEATNVRALVVERDDPDARRTADYLDDILAELSEEPDDFMFCINSSGFIDAMWGNMRADDARTSMLVLNSVMPEHLRIDLSGWA